MDISHNSKNLFKITLSLIMTILTQFFTSYRIIIPQSLQISPWNTLIKTKILENISITFMDLVQTQPHSGTRAMIHWMTKMISITTIIGLTNTPDQKITMWNRKYFLRLSLLLTIIMVSWVSTRKIHSKILQKGRKY